MYSTIRTRIGKTAVTGLVLATLGLGLLGSAGAAHAAPNRGSGEEAGAATCTYAGKDYSEGARVKQDDGNIYRCSQDGTWVLAFTAPEIKLHNSRVGVFQQAN